MQGQACGLTPVLIAVTHLPPVRKCQTAQQPRLHWVHVLWLDGCCLLSHDGFDSFRSPLSVLSIWGSCQAAVAVAVAVTDKDAPPLRHNLLEVIYE